MAGKCMEELLGCVVHTSLTHIWRVLLNAYNATSAAIHAENRTAILQLWHKSVGWQHASESNRVQNESLLEPKVIELRMNIGRVGWELKENMSNESDARWENAFGIYARRNVCSKWTNNKLSQKKNWWILWNNLEIQKVWCSVLLHLMVKQGALVVVHQPQPLEFCSLSSFTTYPTWAR